jgi:hypothetical protein
MHFWGLTLSQAAVPALARNADRLVGAEVGRSIAGSG